MKRSRWGLMAGAAALAALVLGAYQVRASDPVLIAVTAIVDHPALNAVRDGVRDELEAEGYQGDGLNFVYESAQGNPSTAAQIARKFVGENPAVIVPISTRIGTVTKAPGLTVVHADGRREPITGGYEHFAS